MNLRREPKFGRHAAASSAASSCSTKDKGTIINIIIKNTAFKDRLLYDKMCLPGLSSVGYVVSELASTVPEPGRHRQFVRPARSSGVRR